MGPRTPTEGGRTFTEQWVGTRGARTLAYSPLESVCWLGVCLASLPPAPLARRDFTGQGSSCQPSLFWPHHAACGTLVPQPGIEPIP